MNKRIMIAGATGLVGGRFFSRVVADADCSEVVLLGRRSVPELEVHEKVTPLMTDFSDLVERAPACEVDAVVCALGTTLKKAGSRARLFEVDCLYTVAAAAYARKCGASALVVISSVGASPTALSHYLRTKGEMEARVRGLGFQAVHILRPSLLLGGRDETRFGETFGQRMLSPFSRLIPARYRPIHADILAHKIERLVKEPGEGVSICQGDSLGGDRG
ncbi:NAD(P)H-binding protein [Desulfoluna sp.]|uniref:NAD(P)H-binding protein n=1 Tax=Desulfoluna sp. TaxID=2045199 RepID=UPI00260C586E|nr:NAD(P)H-binding protein [Desulfoluna sp.]